LQVPYRRTWYFESEEELEINPALEEEKHEDQESSDEEIMRIILKKIFSSERK